MDLLLTENFDVVLNDRNDLAVTDGQYEVEQMIAMAVTYYFHDEIGSINKVNAANNIEVYAEQVVEQYTELERVDSVDVVNNGDHFEVTINYETADNVSFTITE